MTPAVVVEYYSVIFVVFPHFLSPSHWSTSLSPYICANLPLQQIDRIVSTIQECWDSDPDARLTAQCVQGRFEEFYKAKFQSGNDSYEWSKETGYTSNASFLPDDSNKKVSSLLMCICLDRSLTVYDCGTILVVPDS